jgi:flagellar biosynthesis protein FlhB
MSDSSKPFLPSQSRLAAAAQKGIFPWSDLLVQGLLLAMMSIIAFLFSAWGINGIAEMMNNGLGNLIKPGICTASVAYYALFIIFKISSAFSVFVIIPYLILKKTLLPGGYSYTLLPIKKWKKPGSVHFVLLFLIFATGALISLRLFFYFADSIIRTSNDTKQTMTLLFTFIASLFAAWSVVFIIGGMTQLLIHKTAVLRHLSLSRSEALKESRTQNSNLVKKELL